MMVARQLHRMSKVPRMFGAETKLCRPSAGMVQLGLANVVASAGMIANRIMDSNIFVLFSFKSFLPRASILMLHARNVPQDQGTGQNKPL